MNSNTKEMYHKFLSGNLNEGDVIKLFRKVEQYERSFSDYSDTLNQTRRKRDEVKGKLEIALKTIKEQKQEIELLKNDLEEQQEMSHHYHSLYTTYYRKYFGVDA